jgi:HNH endonuclease
MIFLFRMKLTREERFWKKVDKRTKTECWLWLAALNYGYGFFSPKTGRTVYAHRFVWELVNGPIPHGLCVLHKCDVRSCVNPNHLFLGTNQDNTTDAKRKGRTKGKVRLLRLQSKA